MRRVNKYVLLLYMPVSQNVRDSISAFENVIDASEIVVAEVIDEIKPQYNPIMRLIIFITKSIETCVNSILGIVRNK